jgi:urease accessory protein
MPLDYHLHIIAAYKNDGTFLQNCFCKQPFKLANITEHKADGLLRLMITSSSPGILSNDNYNIAIDIEENANVHISTQGYQRLFTMTGKAIQFMNVHIKNKASFTYLPHPVVPHEASDFSSTNDIYLHKKHNLIWSEIITCGRKLSGEEFKFTRFRNMTNIYIDNKLVIKENVLLEPSKRNIHATGQLEGYTILIRNRRYCIWHFNAFCKWFDISHTWF